MHPGCTHSPEHKAECLARDTEAEHILRLPLHQRAPEIALWGLHHGNDSMEKLKAVITAKFNGRKA
jgi:hypothetical protein